MSITNAPPEQDTASFADFLAALLKHPRFLVGLPLSLAVVAGLFFAFFGSYAAESTFTPESSGLQLSSLAGLAAQFGASLPSGLSGDQSGSVDFYAAVLQSPQLLADVAQTSYRFPTSPTGHDTLSGTLIQLYGVQGDTPEERLLRAVKKLQYRISISRDRLSNIVAIQVKAPWPALAQQINRSMLNRLNEFNLSQRHTTASAEREFAAAQMTKAQQQLGAAEDSMKYFLEENRTYQSSPRLVLESARLQRRIDLRQQVYTTLAQSYEQARLEEVRDTPAITIIQAPELFAQRSRNPLTMAVVVLIVGLVLSSTIVVIWELLLGEWRRSPDDAARLKMLARRAARGLLPFRRS